MAVTTGVLPERYADPRLIGHGGMGEIFLAEDRELGRKVAVKVLADRFARDEGLRSRFTREALAAARLSSEPGVVTIYDVGEWEGRPFIVMEYLAGGTLGARARSRPVHPEVVVDWLAQIAHALDAAHARGIVHRDVKPANLLFDERGEIRVVDFGVARVVDETTGQLTAAGTVLGTAGYISPEQARGESATAASDLYSFAVVAYELLTGGRPFERGSGTSEALAHVHDPVPPVSTRGVGLPPEVDAVFDRALAKDPRRRYPTAAAFVNALRGALAPDEAPTRTYQAAPAPVPAPVRKRPSPLVPLAGALAGVLVLGGLVAAFAATRGGESRAEQTAPSPPSPPPAAAPQEVTVTVEETLPGTTVVQTVTESVPPAPPSPPVAGLTAGEAAALNDQAYGLMRQGRYADALPLLRRALPALRNTFSSGFRYEAYAEYNLGKTLVELGRCGEAMPHLERSEALQGAREPITAAKAQCTS